MNKQEIKKQAAEYAVQVMTMRYNHDEVQDFINRAELDLFGEEIVEISELNARYLFPEDESDALDTEQYFLGCLQVIEDNC